MTDATIPCDPFSNGDNDMILTIHEMPDPRLILKSILEMQLAAAAYLVDIAKRDLEGPYSVLSDRPLTQFDYNGDHVDYNPAAAEVLSIITNELCGDGWIRSELNEDIISALNIPADDWHSYDDDYIQPEFAGKSFIHSSHGLIAALLSNNEFLAAYETWGGLKDQLFEIDYKD